jgi:hypothetical protein
VVLVSELVAGCDFYDYVTMHKVTMEDRVRHMIEGLDGVLYMRSEVCRHTLSASAGGHALLEFMLGALRLLML